MKTHLIFGVLLGAALALVGPLAGEGRGNFTLDGNDQLIVAENHDNGTLWDTSRAIIASGGSVSYINAYNSSSVDISDGSVACLIAYNDSSVDISSGSVSNYLIANDNSSVHVSGGSVNNYLSAGDSSSVHISGGSLSQLSANTSGSVDISGGLVGGLGTIGTSSADITGGSVCILTADYSSSVDISGGSVDWLNALFTSTVTFHGQDFVLGTGLSLDGDRVLGTGILSGEWMDGTPWTVEIYTNNSKATILVTPEPATLTLLAVGGLALLRRRKASRGGFPGAGATGGAGSGRRANAGRGDPHTKAARMMAIAGLAGAALLVSAVATLAGTTNTVNFDAVNAVAGPVAGGVRDAYLAGYGITLSDMTPGRDVYICDQDYFGGPGYIKASSPRNVLQQFAPAAHNQEFPPFVSNPSSFRMNFASPLEQLGFTRVGVDGRIGEGLVFPEWTVSAYNSSGVQLGSAGESMWSTYQYVPPATFTLYGPDIAYAVVASNNYYWAAFGAVILDDFVVPEPATLCLLGLGVAGLVARRRRR